MSIRRATSQRKEFAVGDRVFSKKVGNREAFEGEIVEQVVGGFNVRDDAGNLWLRNSRELSSFS